MRASEAELLGVLRTHMSEITARAILAAAVSWSKVRLSSLKPGEGKHLFDELQKGVRLYVRDSGNRQKCLDALSHLLIGDSEGPLSSRGRKVIPIREESDIVVARGAARSLCGEMGFSPTLQIKVATAVSELARNIVQYAGVGEVSLLALAVPRAGIEVTARDMGPGIRDATSILAGHYKSSTGLGIGLRGTRNIMDEFDLQTGPGRGVEVVVRKYLA